MRIVMMTNDYTPIEYGVTRSIQTLKKHLEQIGHTVLVVAPEIKGWKPEKNVLRTAALKNIYAPYSIPLAIGLGGIEQKIIDFNPDVIHSHHPFLLGGAALRLATQIGVPIVFTRHTRFERYITINAPKLKHLVLKIIDSYSGLCDAVIVPSESIAHGLRKHGGVPANIRVIPSGIDVRAFAKGDGKTFRRYHGIPEDVTLFGYIGRIEPEKNMLFLCRVFRDTLKTYPNAHVVIIGGGTLVDEVKTFFKKAKEKDRVHILPPLKGIALHHAFAALDAFVFASKSETQGLVLAEAMAAGTPVIGLDASGTRDIVRRGVNGWLVTKETVSAFGDAIDRFMKLSKKNRSTLRTSSKRSVKDLTPERYAKEVLKLYRDVKQRKRSTAKEHQPWMRVIEKLQEKWSLYGSAAMESILYDEKAE